MKKERITAETGAPAMPKRSGYTLLITIALILSINSLKLLADMELTGYNKSYIYTDINTGLYTDTGTRFQTLIQAWPNDRTHIFSAFNYDFHNPDSQGVQLDIYPVEFYTNLSWENADLKVGRQFIFWGKASWVNPTDVMNPWDYSRLSGEVEDYRVPVFAVNWSYYWPQITLQTILLPVFEPVSMTMPGIETELPEHNPENAQIGVRLLSYLGESDISLSFYRGFEQRASVVFMGMDMSGSIPQPMLVSKFAHHTMLGADLARSFGSNTLKFEAAYFTTEDWEGDDIYLQNPHIDWVIGVDRSFSDKFSVTGQFSQVIRLNYDEATEISAVSDAGMTAYLQPSPAVSSSISAVIKAEPLPYTMTQIVHVYNLTDGDNFSLGFLSYEVMDAVRLSVGTILFNGPALSPFGRSRNSDKFFAELKINF